MIEMGAPMDKVDEWQRQTTKAMTDAGETPEQVKMYFGQ
jgi:hypothetical protein